MSSVCCLVFFGGQASKSGRHSRIMSSFCHLQPALQLFEAYICMSMLSPVLLLSSMLSRGNGLTLYQITCCNTA